jgi:hypothetical protein
MTTRRTALRILGGGTILAATGLGAFAATRTPTTALRPWAEAGAPAEPRRRALSYAILAPNPHNRQPWVVDLDTPDTVVIWRDRARNLPQTDPFDRQLTIGMGCFIELMAVAASHTGHAVRVTPYPEGEDGPVAVARFDPGASPDPLFAHVLNRRSAKVPFAETVPTPAQVAALRPLARIETDPARVAAIRDLTLAAWMVEAQTPRTHRESVDLFRMGRAEIEANPDGIDLGGPFLEGLMLLGQLDREGLADPASPQFAQSLAMYRTMLLATPAYAVVTTVRNGRAEQIEAGRRWLRLNLAATGLGLALHPVSQALQEYPEMAAHRAQAHAMLAAPGEIVQMLGRLGRAPAQPRTPRWPLETRIRHG